MITGRESQSDLGQGYIANLGSFARQQSWCIAWMQPLLE